MSGAAEAKSGALRIARAFVWLVYAVVAAYVLILGTAFVLRLLGASPTADFVDWIYRASARVMQPFRGMFPPDQVTGASVFDASLLFAVLVYSFLALFLHGIVDWLSTRIYRIAERQEAEAQSLQVPSSRVGPGPSPSGAYGQGAPQQGSYGQGAPEQGSYPQGSYSQGSHSQGSYPQGSYPQGSYGQGVPPDRFPS